MLDFFNVIQLQNVFLLYPHFSLMTAALEMQKLHKFVSNLNIMLSSRWSILFLNRRTSVQLSLQRVNIAHFIQLVEISQNYKNLFTFLFLFFHIFSKSILRPDLN